MFGFFRRKKKTTNNDAEHESSAAHFLPGTQLKYDPDLVDSLTGDH